MAYIDTLSRSLSGYVSPAKFSEARWTAMLQIFVPQPDFGAFSYTNPNSLRSVFSKRKSTMYDLILENRSLSPALPAIAAQATAPGLSQTTATNVPNTNMLSAQAVGAAENDDDEEEGEEEEEEEEGEENKEDM